MSVLITEADHYNTLAIVRSLGKKGINVDVTGYHPFNQSFFSRYSKGKILSPNPLKDVSGFINSLIHQVKKEKYDVLFPVGVKSVLPILFYKNLFSQFVQLPFGSYENTLLAHDKSILLDIAQKIGIPIPKTILPSTQTEMMSKIQSIGFPCVIKLRKSWSSIGIHYARNSDELISYFKDSKNASQGNIMLDYSEPLIQEYVPGEVHDICVLFNEGEPRAALSQKRIKTYPASGGGGILNQTTNEPELIELAIKLLKRINYHGPAQVEFKIDSRTDEPKLMEVNPKFWGTLDLSIKSGIDFPYMAYQLAKYGDVESDYSYEVDKIYKWKVPFDIINLMTSPKLEVIKDVFQINPFYEYDISISDFTPHIAAYIDYFLKYIKRNEVIRR